MPLPIPKKNEKEKQFVSRCMGDATMGSEFPESDQRAAVCHSQFRKSKNKKFREVPERDVDKLYARMEDDIMDTLGDGIERDRKAGIAGDTPDENDDNNADDSDDD